MYPWTWTTTRKGRRRMPYQDDQGETYYNSTESQDYLGIGSFVTFQKIVEEYHLEAKTMPGHGRAKYYKKSELDKVPRFRPVDPQA